MRGVLVVWPVILVGGAAVSSVVAWRKLRRKKYRIAVMGAREVGKTTLIDSWRGEWVADEFGPRPTQIPVIYSRTKLTSAGFRLTFTKLADMSGDFDAWPQWEDFSRESRYVLYLVDARALAGYLEREATRNWYRLEDDAGRVGGFLREGHAELCVVVVTHTDQDERLEKLGEAAYRELVVAQLDPLMLKIGGPQKARVVVGSLKTRQGADDVTSRVMRDIIGWEKSKK
jgi:GTPase SAR1 family protein